jgi:hypothetical protein
MAAVSLRMSLVPPQLGLRLYWFSAPRVIQKMDPRSSFYSVH